MMRTRAGIWPNGKCFQFMPRMPFFTLVQLYEISMQPKRLCCQWVWAVSDVWRAYLVLLDETSIFLAPSSCPVNLPCRTMVSRFPCQSRTSLWSCPPFRRPTLMRYTLWWPCRTLCCCEAFERLKDKSRVPDARDKATEHSNERSSMHAVRSSDDNARSTGWTWYASRSVG